jgi:hypothetical protein
MHVLKLRKVVDEIAEHVVEKLVRLNIFTLFQHATVHGSGVCQAPLVMKNAT